MSVQTFSSAQTILIVVLIIGLRFPSAFSVSAVHLATETQAAMPALCDAQYTADMNDTLRQFQGFTDLKTLRDYQDFMIRVKYHEDLGYKVRPFERSLTADRLAKWRTPLQHYITCRTSITSAYSRNVRMESLEQDMYLPCDQTYAIEANALLREHAPIMRPQELAQFRNYLTLLKQKGDLYVRLGDFEKLISNDKVNKLRAPMRRYNNCVDAIIRTAQPYATYGSTIVK